jgi:hypothetical protein
MGTFERLFAASTDEGDRGIRVPRLVTQDFLSKVREAPEVDRLFEQCLFGKSL